MKVTLNLSAKKFKYKKFEKHSKKKDVVFVL